MSVDEVTESRDRVHEACRDHDRDPATMLLSVSQVVCCGTDEAEVKRRAGAIGREPDEVRQTGIAGTPDECVAKIKAFESVGVAVLWFGFSALTNSIACSTEIGFGLMFPAEIS